MTSHQAGQGERHPISGDDAQHAPAGVIANRGGAGREARHEERAVEQEARDHEEERDPDVQPRRRGRERAGVVGAGEEGAWVTSTASAAIARSGSTSGKRSPAVRIGDHTVSVGRPKRGFALRLAGLAAAGVVLRALYLFTIARHVSGAGDWHFYHYQAN